MNGKLCEKFYRMSHCFRSGCCLWKCFALFATLMVSLMAGGHSWAGDLDEVIKAGRLRHLGIPYANFIVGENAGLDSELMQLFCNYLGVKYEFVETGWQEIIGDLTGKVVKPKGEQISIVGSCEVRGDVIATGFTVLPWREKIVDYSETTFPTGVWLISRGDSPLQPITPTGNIEKDIESVKKTIGGASVLGLKDSCLDPDLYQLGQTGAHIKLFPADQDLEDMIPAILARNADTALMDVPVALIALERRPGEIKVVGPVSPPQGMACAFAKTSPNLRKSFSLFYKKIKADGTYRKLVEKYYPSVFSYYPDFLKK